MGFNRLLKVALGVEGLTDLMPRAVADESLSESRFLNAAMALSYSFPVR